MAVPVVVAKAAAVILSNEKGRKAIGWLLVAALSPVILMPDTSPALCRGYPTFYR